MEIKFAVTAEMNPAEAGVPLEQNDENALSKAETVVSVEAFDP